MPAQVSTKALVANYSYRVARKGAVNLLIYMNRFFFPSICLMHRHHGNLLTRPGLGHLAFGEQPVAPSQRTGDLTTNETFSCYDQSVQRAVGRVQAYQKRLFDATDYLFSRISAYYDVPGFKYELKRWMNEQEIMNLGVQTHVRLVKYGG